MNDVITSRGRMLAELAKKRPAASTTDTDSSRRGECSRYLFTAVDEADLSPLVEELAQIPQMIVDDGDHQLNESSMLTNLMPFTGEKHLDETVLTHSLGSNAVHSIVESHGVTDKGGLQENVNNLSESSELEPPVTEDDVNSQSNYPVIQVETNTETRDLGDRSASGAQKRRILGQAYLGYRVENKKIHQDTPKEERRIQERCKHNDLIKKSDHTYLCALFTEEEREAIFKVFWAMSTWEEKKGYVRGLINSRAIRRRRKHTEEQSEIIKKMEGHDVFLQKSTGETLKVCRLFFLKTLNIGEDTFKRWVKDDATADEGEKTRPVEQIQQNQSGAEKRKSENKEVNQDCCKRRKKTQVENVRAWLELLPKVPSHYCRASSKRVYVESTFRSIAHMHNIYQEWCANKQHQSVGRKLFQEVLSEEKISIHLPRKDQCDVCYGFKMGNITTDIHEEHIKKKNDAREAKRRAKESCSEEKLVLTMDLQSVVSKAASIEVVLQAEAAMP